MFMNDINKQQLNIRFLAYIQCHKITRGIEHVDYLSNMSLFLKMKETFTCTML